MIIFPMPIHTLSGSSLDKNGGLALLIVLNFLLGIAFLFIYPMFLKEPYKGTFLAWSFDLDYWISSPSTKKDFGAAFWIAFFITNGIAFIVFLWELVDRLLSGDFKRKAKIKSILFIVGLFSLTACHSAATTPDITEDSITQTMAEIKAELGWRVSDSNAIIKDMVQERFVPITPEQGTLELMTEGGTFSSPVITQVYFIKAIKENSPLLDSSKRIRLTEGFIVIKLKRYPSDKNTLSYKMLDSLNESKQALTMNLDGVGTRWTEEEKKYWRDWQNLYRDINYRFHQHVRWYVEKSALKAGISRFCFLSYEK